MQPRKNTVIYIFAVSLGLANGVAAHADVLADYGCHQDEITDSYFCSSGPLEGREFLSQSELEDAIETQKAKDKAIQIQNAKDRSPAPTFAAVEKPKDKIARPPMDHFIVMSWNMRALAGEGSDYDRAALVLAQADVATLQEMDLSARGKGFLNVIANLIQAKTQEKICRAWVQSADGRRQNYGFIWKEATIGWVDGEGAITETCGETAVTIHQSKKMKLGSQATFYFKAQKKMFTVGGVFLDRKPKDKDAGKTVIDLFKAFDESKWPVIVAGDLKMGPGNPAFAGARSMDFHSSLGASKKAWDNIWYRGATLSQASAVNLFDRFSDARREDIRKGFSGISPVAAEFTLTAPPVEDSVSLAPKSKIKKKAAKPGQTKGG